DLDAVPAAGGDEAVEVFDRPERRIDGRMAALLAPDRPRAARVARPGGERVVPALAIRAADRVDRRQVDDVEARLRQLGQRLLDSGEASPRTREQLVPRAEARPLPVDEDAELSYQPGRLRPVRLSGCEG